MKNLSSQIEKLKTKLRNSRRGKDPQEWLDDEQEAEIEQEIEEIERAQDFAEDQERDL